LLPDDYLPDVQLRLVLYKRIAAAATEEELREMQVEMIDRFGLLPQPAKNLFAIAAAKQAARRLGLRRIDMGPGGGSVVFEAETKVEPATLIRYVQHNARTHRLEGGTKLRFTLKLETEPQRFAALEALLTALSAKPPAASGAKTDNPQRARR
jgi:transcription-repair coupling factor (superfamily II helicase)